MLSAGFADGVSMRSRNKREGRYVGRCREFLITHADGSIVYLVSKRRHKRLRGDVKMIRRGRQVNFRRDFLLHGILMEVNGCEHD